MGNVWEVKQGNIVYVILLDGRVFFAAEKVMGREDRLDREMQKKGEGGGEDMGRRRKKKKHLYICELEVEKGRFGA